MVCQWFGLKTTRTVSHQFGTQNQWQRFVSGLGLKITQMVFTGLARKSVATVSSGLASKPTTTVFSSLASKLVAMVSPGLASKPEVGFLVEPQNQGGGGFPGLGLKIDNSGLVIWASKSPQRFLVWASKPCRLPFSGCASKPTEGGRCETHIEI
jgi:hypothetical protein